MFPVIYETDLDLRSAELRSFATAYDRMLQAESEGPEVEDIIAAFENAVENAA